MMVTVVQWLPGLWLAAVGIAAVVWRPRPARALDPVPVGTRPRPAETRRLPARGA